MRHPEGEADGRGGGAQRPAAALRPSAHASNTLAACYDGKNARDRSNLPMAPTRRIDLERGSAEPVSGGRICRVPANA